MNHNIRRLIQVGTTTPFMKQIIEKKEQHMAQQRTPKKYNMIDLFWFMNDKLINDRNNLEDNEGHFCTVSFNMDFGNLRVEILHATDLTFYKSVVFKQSMKLLVNGTIYPSSCYQICSNFDKPFACMEQLITNTGEQWQKERPIVYMRPMDSGDNAFCPDIRMDILDQKSGINYFYDFKGWQLDAFKQACTFAFNDGFILAGEQKLKGDY